MWLRFTSLFLMLNSITGYRSNQLELVHASRSVQKIVVHNLRDRRRAHRLVQALLKRKSDRKCHLGKLPNGDLVLLKVRRKEANCIEAKSLPVFDLDVYFPEGPTIIEESSDETDSRPEGSVPVFIRGPLFEEDLSHDQEVIVLDEDLISPRSDTNYRIPDSVLGTPSTVASPYNHLRKN